MMALGLSLLDESIHVGGRPGDGVREWAGAPGWAPQEENWLQEGEGDGGGPELIGPGQQGPCSGMAAGTDARWA